MATELILKETGEVVARTVAERILRVDLPKFLTDKVLNDVVFVTPPIVAAPSIGCSDMRAVFCGNSECPGIAVRMETLNFNAPWKEEGNKLVPDFANGNVRKGEAVNPARAVPELLLKVPEFLEAWIVMDLYKMEVNRAVLGVLAPLGRKESPKTHIFPLPNVFDDGSLCLGAQRREKEKTPRIMDVAAQCLETWYHSPWNGDLYTNQRRRKAEKLFAWDADTGKRIEPSEETWLDCLVPAAPGNQTASAFFAKRISELSVAGTRR